MDCSVASDGLNFFLKFLVLTLSDKSQKHRQNTGLKIPLLFDYFPFLIYVWSGRALVWKLDEAAQEPFPLPN